MATKKTPVKKAPAKKKPASRATAPKKVTTADLDAARSLVEEARADCVTAHKHHQRARAQDEIARRRDMLAAANAEIAEATARRDTAFAKFKAIEKELS